MENFGRFCSAKSAFLILPFTFNFQFSTFNLIIPPVQFFEKGVRGEKLSFKKVFSPHKKPKPKPKPKKQNQKEVKENEYIENGGRNTPDEF